MDQCTVLENLLKGCGVVEKVPEKLMDPLGVLTGCGPAFVSIFYVKHGFSEALQMLVRFLPMWMRF